jgi:hypothetical protein
MVMGMQSVFVVGGEDLPALPEVYAKIFVHGSCHDCWRISSISTIEDLKDISYWGIGQD